MNDVDAAHVFDLMGRLLRNAYDRVVVENLSDDEREWRCGELLRARDNLEAAKEAYSEGRIGAALWLYGGTAEMLARHALPDDAEHVVHGVQNRIAALAVANQRRQIAGLKAFVLDGLDERLAGNRGNVSRTAKNLTAEWNGKSAEQCSAHTVRGYINEHLRRRQN